jgi:hypothetical protein
MTMTNKAGASGALTEAELCNWLGNALPKDRLTYHRGFWPSTAIRGRADSLRRSGQRLDWSLIAQGAPKPWGLPVSFRRDMGPMITAT